MPNVLARQQASERGAYEAWFVDSEGMVTEGAASNAWIISMAGVIVTRQLDHSILRGITRTTLIEILGAEGLKLEERKFNLDEAFAAREAFITGATTLIMPVVRIDGRAIGAGFPDRSHRSYARFFMPAPRSPRKHWKAFQVNIIS